MSEASEMNVRIELLSAHHQRTAFDCGESALNQFLHQQAGQLARKNVSKTYVAVADDGITVQGFVAVSVGQIQTAQLPPQLKLPRYPIPIFRIGRLGVDRLHQGKGIGQQLMAFALQLALDFSTQVGVYAVVVDAKDDNASHFYQTLGFNPSLDQPLCLFLPITQLQKLQKLQDQKP